MTPKEIAQLIKACKNAGITEFRLGDLYLKFSIEPTAPQATPLTEADKLVELERRIAEDEDLKQLQLQNLMMEDPLAYEELRSGANYQRA